MTTRADYVWPLISGGCHAARATYEAIERPGFAIESKRYFDFRPSIVGYFVALHTVGVARGPTTA